MRTYLATLHRRPHHHKKRFALLTSASVTLIIFSLWSLVKFGDDPVIAREEPSTFATNTVSPMETMSASAHNSWKALQEQFGKAFQGLKSLDVGTEYYEVRNDALNSNGR